ncbi:cytochrome P450 [Gymnopus androsaceus JB14]|uniref:Cytochrome P450 n=1 Tax=Gymnopus androsaceus JB14 TaxID=1447944 RepID=A0A6A4H6K8_9AGAR|nr:cytochrome P450 [Gymnopus androsaceus JB14]
MTTQIPQPPRLPFIGNVTQLDRELPINGFTLLAQQYGEIFKLDILGKEVIFLNTQELVNEVSDDTKFRKKIGGGLLQVRHALGDGLFTADEHEPNWGIAHRLLMPAFNALAVRDMIEDMRDICDQVLLKVCTTLLLLICVSDRHFQWERYRHLIAITRTSLLTSFISFGPEYVIDPSDDLTRVALDTIALCSMSYRLNSFYTVSPFAAAMTDFLKECSARISRPAIIQALMTKTTAKWEEDTKFMTDIGNRILEERKKNPVEKKDLLNTMLYSKDPKTGEGLPDDAIMKNLLTFLVAGHETSSGMMSFMTYYLIKNPETMRKLQTEIDEVLGGEPVQYQDLSKMVYLNAVMRETLRLAPTAPIRTTVALEDTCLANGKYFIKGGSTLFVNAWVYQKDPKVWGKDANEFHPERMLNGKFDSLPPNSWQPFGFGIRGCIGRPFAWQEVSLVMASILQKFDLSFVDPAYNLELKQALTVKPKDLFIHARLRNRSPRFHSTSRGLPKQIQQSSVTATSRAPSEARRPIYLFYGSNTGSSEAFAQRIASEAPNYGTLDSATGHLPTDGPVVICTASYEGQPADNAARFVDWLSALKADELKGVRYAVFGCGNSDWVQTYQRIPTLVDTTLEERGAERLLTRGAGDSNEGNFFDIFDQFVSDLWTTLTKVYSTVRSDSPSSGFAVEIVDPGTSRPTALRQTDAGLGRVVENRILTRPGHPIKRHIEFELPEGSTYRAGDYLTILPQNPPRDVRRVLARFGLSNEQTVTISSVAPTFLPVDKPVSLAEILSGYVELSQPATTQDLRILIEATTSGTVRAELTKLKDSYQDTVLLRRLSVLDLLEKYPKDLNLDLSTYLRMLPPMRIRQYSISSSPLWNAQHVTLTVSVLEAEALSGEGNVFLGVASNYLSELVPGDRVQMSVRASAAAFHPPEDPSIPLVAYCAGSGLAPIRGFIQERALQKMSGREVGRSFYFSACRDPEADFLYCGDDLAEWTKHWSFSRSPDKSKGCKYIQDRLWVDKEDVANAFHSKAQFFVCGSNKVAKAVKIQCAEILRSFRPGLDQVTAVTELETLLKGRFTTGCFRLNSARLKL